MATATRVHAAILDRVREEELAERIQCFLLVEKRIKPVLPHFFGTAGGFTTDFWENPDILSRVYV
jgi:hypothetical protein